MTRFRHTLRSPEALVDAGLMAPEREREAARVASRYAIAITPAMAELIDPADPNDPIALQFLPDERELDTHPAELADPIGDHLKSPVPGLVHRYRDRVLLKVIGICPVYCRFCFRREMVGPQSGANLTAEEIETALAYIRAHPEIWEVILTGGDPFLLSPRRAAEIARALDTIDHVRVLRWHTRVPVAAPERVTPELVQALKASTKAVHVAVHANHPRELTAAAKAALARLVDAGIPVVSQTVLLKDINDDADTLEALMRGLVEARVKPYYLHHGDLAPGTAHFRTSIAHGQHLMRTLRGRLSGLALPTYVLDLPGAHGKVSAEAATPVGSEPGHYRFADASGALHDYRECCTPPDPRPDAP